MNDLRLIRDEADQVTLFRAGTLDDLRMNGRDELRNTRVEAAGGHLRDGNTFSAVPLGPLGPAVGLRAGEFRSAGDDDALDQLGVLEDGKVRRVRDVGDVVQL